MATIETRDYLTCSEAAEELGLTADSVRVYLNNERNGKTPALKGLQIGREWLIHKSEVARYQKDRNNPGRPSDDE